MYIETHRQCTCITMYAYICTYIHRLTVECVAFTNNVDLLFIEVGVAKRYDSYELDELEQLKNDVEALYAHGGGDCPELGMEGIWRALDLTNEDSHIIVLTDASCLDYHKKDDVIKLAKELRTKIHFFFSGSGCGGNGFPHYEEVRSVTGGIRVTSIDTFNSLSMFITNLEITPTASKRSIHSVNSSLSLKCQTFNVSVFTIKFELIINQNSTYAKIYDPLGYNVETEHINDEFSGYVSNGKPRNGSWTICTVDEISKFSVTKKDILDLSVDFYQDGHYSSAIPMGGIRNCNIAT